MVPQMVWKKRKFYFLICFLAAFYSAFAQNNYRKDVMLVYAMLTNPSLINNSDTLQKYVKEKHSYFLKHCSAEYTIKVFEEAVYRLSTEDYKRSIVITFFWISESYHKQLEKGEVSIKEIEQKYLSYIHQLESTCLRSYLYSYLAYLYANENVRRYADAKKYFERTLEESRVNHCGSRFANLQYLEIGSYIYERMGDYPTSLFYKIKAVEVSDSLKAPALRRAHYLDQLARLHYRSENYSKAFAIWARTLEIYKNEPSKKREIIQAYNNLGLVKRASKSFLEAEKFFNLAIKEAEKQKDSTWIAIVKGNIGISYFRQKRYEEAIPYIEQDVRYCVKSLEIGNAANSLAYLGDIYLALKDYEKAKVYYDSSLHMIQKKRDWTIRSQPQMEMEIKEKAHKGLSEVHEKLGNQQEAYTHLKIYLQNRDSLLFIKTKNNVAFLQAQYEFDKIERLKENQIKEQKLWIIIQTISIIAFLVIAIIAYRFYKLQNIKKKLEIENVKLAQKAEKERNARLQEELVLADRNLTIKALQLYEKNEALIDIRHELEKEDKLGKKVDKLIDNTIKLDEDWEDFKKHFEEVHPQFFQYLQKNYDKLTQNDLRHCAYIRLSLDNKQIAYLMSVGVDSLKVSRTRLRKKLVLPIEADLFKFLSNIG